MIEAFFKAVLRERCPLNVFAALRSKFRESWLRCSPAAGGRSEAEMKLSSSDS